MKLDTKKKRLWFVIWCLWSIGWFVAYIVGGFFVLRDCNLYRSAIMTCEFDFKLFGFIFHQRVKTTGFQPVSFSCENEEAGGVRWTTDTAVTRYFRSSITLCG